MRLFQMNVKVEIKGIIRTGKKILLCNQTKQIWTKQVKRFVLKLLSFKAIHMNKNYLNNLICLSKLMILMKNGTRLISAEVICLNSLYLLKKFQ